MNLSDTLERLAELLDAHGELAWQRCHDWTTTGRMPSSGVRGGGTGSGASDATLEERAGDRQAAAYWDELNTVAERLFNALAETAGSTVVWRSVSPRLLARECRLAYADRVKDPDRVHNDAERIIRIIAIACPMRPKHLGNKDLLAAQIAVDGWCLSCWRDNKYLEPVEAGRYRDRCRWCGDWRGVHGQDPPADLVRIRHARPNGRVTAAEVDRAMGRA